MAAQNAQTGPPIQVSQIDRMQGRARHPNIHRNHWAIGEGGHRGRPQLRFRVWPVFAVAILLPLIAACFEAAPRPGSILSTALPVTPPIASNLAPTDTPTPTDTPVPSPTPAPTPEPTPLPTPTPTHPVANIDAHARTIANPAPNGYTNPYAHSHSHS